MPSGRIDAKVNPTVSIAGPASRFQGDYFEEELARLVSDAANMIELKIQEY
ncbi:IclR family transcriptional regulator C-terminal domain-containing protein [Haloplanus natans]|uniref:IclR family transcriptional regulator C-terminal domain-containing protein n=1 Tax=Haloplanus natans TaxID=376171 RepID=UPI0012FA3DF7|nr:IclR family transcriptional regulator C-terminal domain-containing protein [Haloplanus natans]